MDAARASRPYRRRTSHGRDARATSIGKLL